MSIFFIAIALACGFSFGYLFALGKRRKTLPRVGTIMSIQTVEPDGSFTASYNGFFSYNVVYFKDGHGLIPGTYEVVHKKEVREGLFSTAVECNTFVKTLKRIELRAPRL
jgi:hypothetical protein